MKKSVVIFLNIGYWLLYLLLVSSFILVIQNGNKHPSLVGLGRILLLSSLSVKIILPSVIGFYSFYSFIFFKYLARKKNIALFVSGISISLFYAVIVVLLPAAMSCTKNNFATGWGDKVAETLFLFALILIQGIIGLIIRGFIIAYGDIKLKEQLNQKNYEMELALVKSQIDPHFLFNTLNNIDVLILKNAQKASVYLNKLSDIMRFMLYETKANKIPLTKELAYIEKYIDLQKIRASNPNYVNYSITGDATNIQISPMLLIPFIENAFKYTENIKNETTVHIIITLEREKLVFICENNYHKGLQLKQHSGLGNELIEKRLRLLYPGMYKLDVVNKNETYKATLLLYYHEN